MYISVSLTLNLGIHVAQFETINIFTYRNIRRIQIENTPKKEVTQP